ncbi:phage baseplate protein [Acinetobacter venetianus]|uniref:Baseplate structural protein Gp10 C-terminal domain-containing protein n=1 Tax=Acinetobacter venetianus TaxID=52133 RepID=A0A150HQ74_9GAMM|nr:hypothetical protein [Acinetobacter venetianus]KXZ68753.1 hypothetical protein AVENLUH13518_02913 [Acinetobacter venetianus]
MPVNQFLPFAIDEDANVMSQVDYETLTARQSGFQTGVASSQQLNKVWRQSSTVTSVLTQFICNNQSNDVLDNGETSNLLGQLELALVNLFLPVGSIISSFDSDFDPNMKYVGTTWVLHGQGRVPVGLSTQTEDPSWTKTVANEFGEYAHTLTTDELPNFQLESGVVMSSGTIDTNAAAYGTSELASPTDNSIMADGGACDVTALTSSIGGDQPHQNVQPSIVEARWRRTA